MLVLGIESSCDETGLALYRHTPMPANDGDAPAQQRSGLLAHALHSQIDMHREYGGVVPELASRDHIRRAIPLLETVLASAGVRPSEIDAVAYTAGPGLAGALLVGSSIANALAYAWQKPVIGIHHLEGHLLSPLLASNPPDFPFVALLVSGGHTQLMSVRGVGDYEILGETLDDAAGEAFDKTAKLLGLSYPGGPAVSALANDGRPGAITLPRPMLHSGDLDFSFSGLKTAVLTQVKRLSAASAMSKTAVNGANDGTTKGATNAGTAPAVGTSIVHASEQGSALAQQDKADIARAFVDAAVEVLVAKSLNALKRAGMKRLVVAGGVGANRQLREALNAAAARKRFSVFYPDLDLCTDNGAMIALAGALRIARWPEQARHDYRFTVSPRWELGQPQPA